MCPAVLAYPFLFDRLHPPNGTSSIPVIVFTSIWRQARRYFCRYTTGIEEIIWLDVTPRQLFDSLPPQPLLYSALFFNDPFMTRYVNNNERHHSASHKLPGVYTIFQHTITNPILSQSPVHHRRSNPQLVGSCSRQNHFTRFFVVVEALVQDGENVRE